MTATTSTRGQSPSALPTQSTTHQAESDAAEPSHQHKTNIAPGRVTRAAAKRTRELALADPAHTPTGEPHPADTSVTRPAKTNTNTRHARGEPATHGDTCEAAAVAAEPRATRASRRAAAREARAAPPGQLYTQRTRTRAQFSSAGYFASGDSC